MVLVGVGILNGEFEASRRQLLSDVFARGHARGGRFVCQHQGGPVELRVSGHPSALGGLHQSIGEAHLLEVPARQRRGNAFGAAGIVAPLVCGEIPETGSDHLACGTLPVQRHGVLLPARDGANLLLAHVVCPAAPILSLRGTHRGQG